MNHKDKQKKMMKGGMAKKNMMYGGMAKKKKRQKYRLDVSRTSLPIEFK